MAPFRTRTPLWKIMHFGLRSSTNRILRKAGSDPTSPQPLVECPLGVLTLPLIEYLPDESPTISAAPTAPQMTFETPKQDTPSLLLLPTELLLLVSSFLPDSSAIALTQSCRRFRATISKNVEDLFDRFYTPNMDPTCLFDQRRYQEIIQRSYSSVASSGLTSNQLQCYYCTACGMNHYSRKFSIQNLRAPLNERRCLKAEGVLWFCPHKIWSYGEVISQAKNRNELYPYNQRESDIYGLCACEEHFYNNFFGMGFRAFPIDVFSSRTQITWTALYERLHGVHPRICPHLTVSDSAVLVKFSDQCTQTFDATGFLCSCWNCSPQNICNSTDLPHCGNCWTKVWFKRLHNANGTITLYLVIGQKINAEELSGANCENWKKYLSLPSELKGPQKEWDEHQICCIKDSELKKQVLSPSNNPFLAWEAVDWRD